jgi:AAA domain
VAEVLRRVLEVEAGAVVDNVRRSSVGYEHMSAGGAERGSTAPINGPSVEELCRLSADELLDHLAKGVRYSSDAQLAERLGAINWTALNGQSPPPRTWWIQDWLGPSPTLCSGKGGIGKSLLWQTLGTALSTGKEFLGATVKPLRVLLWACEDDRDELWRRQVAINAHLGVTMNDLGRIFIMPRRGLENTLMELEFGKPTLTGQFVVLREQVNDLLIDLLILDNIGQTYGGNESDRHQVTKFVNSILGLVPDRPFAPVFLGHPARANNSEFSGSSAWENACRMRMYMGNKLPDQETDDEESDATDPDIVYLCRRKTNYSQKDWRRLHYQNGLFVPEGLRNGRKAEKEPPSYFAQQAVLKAMPKLIAMGLCPSDSKNSLDYLPKNIIEKGLADNHPRRELIDAMNFLMTAGRLKRAPNAGKYPNRRPRPGLVVVVDPEDTLTPVDAPASPQDATGPVSQDAQPAT